MDFTQLIEYILFEFIKLVVMCMLVYFFAWSLIELIKHDGDENPLG